MAVGVNVPQRRQQGDGGLGQIMSLGQAVAPMFGPAGVAASAGLGAAKILSADNKQSTPGPEAVQTSGGAMQRRMNSIQESPQMQIANSIDSLKYIQDPAQRAELAKPLMQADYMARNKQA